jgi:hypothetical protein
MTNLHKKKSLCLSKKEKKRHSIKPINRRKVGYLDKFANHANLIKRQNKMKQIAKINSQLFQY